MEDCKDSNCIIKSEIGFVTKCDCCDTYNVHMGVLTLRFKDRELHSLLYMLLKTLRQKGKAESRNFQ